jgi:hypothetical protein
VSRQRRAALPAVAVTLALTVTGCQSANLSAGPRPPRTAAQAAAALQRQPELPATTAGNAVFQAASSCGVERWAIKTGQDAAARSVELSRPKPVTVATLRSYPQPTSYPANSRIGAVEKTAYRLDVTLTKYKLEGDSDLHLVVADAQGRTLIVEVPDPSCMGSSPWKSRVATARQTFMSRYGPTSSFKRTSKHAVIVGVGFFDRLHGQAGVSPNGIELHAVTSITF